LQCKTKSLIDKFSFYIQFKKVFTKNITLTLLFILFIISVLGYWFVETQKWFYIWQLKQYRLDKFLDYLSLLESRQIVFNTRLFLRLSWLFLAILLLVFLQKDVENWQTVSDNFGLNLQILALILILALNFAEFGIYILKILTGKRVLQPVFTKKAILVFIINFVTIFFFYATVIWFFKFGLLLAVIITLLGFYLPFNLGLAILILEPVDRIAKQKFYQKAKEYRETLSDLHTITIAGAFGKTSVKEALNSIFQTKYKTQKTIKNQNTEMAVARQVLELDSDVEYFFAELGSYTVGDAPRTCKFVHPQTAFITGLNYQHLSLFGSLENIITAETTALRFLKEDSLVIVNWTAPINHGLFFDQKFRVFRYGLKDKIDPQNQELLDAYPVEIKTISEKDKYYSTFKLIFSDRVLAEIQKAGIEVTGLSQIVFKTSWLSLGLVENLSGAILLSLLQKINPAQIQEVIQNLEPIPKNLEPIYQDELLILNDSYNANVDGVKNAFSLVGEMVNRYKIICLDDVLELGKRSEFSHQQIAQALAQISPDRVYLLGRNYKKIVLDELLKNGLEKSKIKVTTAATAQAEIQEILKNQNQKSVVLLEGMQAGKVKLL